MSEFRDPPRWVLAPHTPSSEGLQRLFQEAERDVPNDSQLAALESRLRDLMGSGVAGPQALEPQPEPPLHATRAPLSRAGKLGLVGLAVGVVAAGVAVVVLVNRKAPDPTPPVLPAPSRTITVPSQPAPLPPSPPAVDSSLVPPSPTPSSAEPAPAQEAEPKRAQPPRVAPNTPSAASEAELLERARKALAQDPTAALALTRTHEVRFASGLLRQEREVIAIEALRRLGRQAEASARAERFSKTYPGSAHRRGVETGLGQ
ncbi:MAG TPA: hypothetical protein VFQ61_09785 [Polyangiaceae bacterium]|nr:hypothetical protein [Polyangiaceae bacterium]